MTTKGKFLDRPIAFHRCFVDLTGSVNAALMLSQACYWAVRSQPGGRFYKSGDEWQEETGLSRREQESARAILRRFPFWREEYKRVEHRLYFTVGVDAVVEAVEGAGTLSAASGEKGEGLLPPNGGNGHSPMAETAIRECTKAPFGNGGNGHSRMHQTAIRYKEQRLPETTSEREDGQRADRPASSLSKGNGSGNGVLAYLKEFFERTWRERFGSNPTWHTKDYAQLALLVKRQTDFPLREFEDRWQRYLADGEGFVAKQGYSLAYFCSRFDAYIDYSKRRLDVPELKGHEEDDEWYREQRRLQKLRESNGGGG